MDVNITGFYEDFMNISKNTFEKGRGILFALYQVYTENFSKFAPKKIIV